MKYLLKLLFENIVLGIILALCIAGVFKLLGIV